ncbi:H-NS histone family protein [Paraburkholderia tropica]|uniref:H-NS histone family protein n=1 Tax=Paraburkholderia tropica TaxID=92647 RepID=UPI001CB0F043|nr:H-NS histone family protein [Paraburkholderia tropica]CAG9207499.1 DNA-binding protein H-NS [Paraburkholderia tropica]
MATYRELKAKIAELEAAASEVRAEEIADVLTELRAKVAEFGLTQEQIFGAQGRAAPHPTLPPKYRDPVTGSTWSGRGRAPAWIATAKKRERFLIR